MQVALQQTSFYPPVLDFCDMWFCLSMHQSSLSAPSGFIAVVKAQDTVRLIFQCWLLWSFLSRVPQMQILAAARLRDD